MFVCYRYMALHGKIIRVDINIESDGVIHMVSSGFSMFSNVNDIESILCTDVKLSTEFLRYLKTYSKEIID